MPVRIVDAEAEVEPVSPGPDIHRLVSQALEAALLPADDCVDWDDDAADDAPERADAAAQRPPGPAMLVAFGIAMALMLFWVMVRLSLDA
ncbi:MAG TPA: hypothetical protein VME92_08765 [Acetobacteraceae bacterium]|nr:hypothetical protein [Acetobacteraceae bacterium]